MPQDKTQGSSRGSELMPPKVHGKRSARPRGRNYTPWAPLQGLLNSVKKIKKYVDDKSVGSKTMKSAKGDNMSSSASKMAPKLKVNIGEDTKYKLLAVKTEITERIDPKTRGKRSVRHRVEHTLWASQDEVQKSETGQNKHGDDQAVGSKKMKTTSKGKEKTGADNDVTKKIDIDTSAEVKNGTSADANKQDGGPSPDTPMESMDNKHVGEGADAIQKEDALMTDDAVASGKESTAAAANALEQQVAATQATDVTYPMEDHKADNGAEAALASIYGSEPSEWDLCITFAVKLLMDETPLAEDAAEVEEFFRQKMNDTNSTNVAGPSVP